MATQTGIDATAKFEIKTQEKAENTEPKGKKIESSPYLSGDQIKNDDGPLLSIFMLQEILDKVRETQIRTQAAGQELEAAPPDVKNLLTRLLGLKDLKGYNIVSKLPVSFRFISAQSENRLFRVNNFKERISEIGKDSKCENPLELLNVVLQRVKYVREQGSFILYDVPTHFVNGNEVLDHDALGMDVTSMFSSLSPANRFMLQNQLEEFLISNQWNEKTLMDVFNGACDDAIYKVHTALMSYVENGQLHNFRQSLNWLQAYGECKNITYDSHYLTDVFSSENLYCLSYKLPVDPNVIWEVPRSSISNMIMNAALGFPTGAYVSPTARIASVTVTSRITTNTPFAQLQSMVPTEAVMADVRKIYFALCYPNQVLIDIRQEPGHQIDPIIQAVSGLFGKMMFSYGPRYFNITRRTAGLFDRGCAHYLQMMTDDRRTIQRGQSGEALDFMILQGGRQFDCRRLGNDPDTGRGFNNWRVDSLRRRDTPYSHVSRRVCYLGYDSEEVLDERYSGSDYTYPLHELLMEALLRAGHVAEKNYLQLVLQHHVVRFAYINQVINRDLLSAFTMPDDKFTEQGDAIPRDIFTADGPVVLDVSYLSIWFAFKLRFLPTDRPALMIQQPLLESVYASHLSLVKLAAKELMSFVSSNPENFTTLKASDVWKIVMKEMPEVLHDILDMIGQRNFITMRDVNSWIESDLMQESMLLTCDLEAWKCLSTPNDIMFVKDVFIHAENIPEPVVDDIEVFRREAYYYTNMRDSLPPNERCVYLNKSSMLSRAGEGRLKSSIRSMIDDGDYIKVGNSLRPLVLQFFESMPPQNIREALPFTYSVDRTSGPLTRVVVSLTEKIIGYVLLYTVDKDFMPDEYVSYLPSKNLTKISLQSLPFSRVDASTALDVTSRVFQSFRKKVRIIDLTESLEVGAQLASLASLTV
uniref:VP3 n=1 Tax=Peruvian horse sickness virus TaxID=356862 RepID=A0A7L7PZT6_9REOV|nr:VP3 [Peruvian horse sickness virus]